MARRLGRGDATRGRARVALLTVTLLMGVVVALVPTGSPTTARAAGGRAVQPQETFESASPTPSGSASPSAPVETFAPSERTITIRNPLDPPSFRDFGEVRGVVDSDNPTCEGGQRVRIDRRLAESSDFTRFSTTTTGSDGRYRVVFEATENADYIASVDQTASCAFAESDPVEVKVRVAVFLGVSDTRVTAGELVTFRARVIPCGDHSKTKVELLRRRKDDEDDTVNSMSRNLDRECKAVFDRKVFATTIFRAFWPEQDNDHTAGDSDRITIKVIV